MTTDRERQDRLVMPGNEPTDDDLRHDVELTRQELARTVAALGEKADVKGRVRTATHRRAEAVQARGEELVGRLPEPVAERFASAWRSMWDRPGRSLAGLAALVAVLMVWRRIRGR